MKKHTIVVCLLIIVLCGSGFAQTPRSFSYQGQILNGGKPLTGIHYLHIGLYDSPTGGSIVHSETIAAEIENGIFTVTIGAQKEIARSVTFEKQYWLGISVDEDAELSPRTILRSVPYAVNASSSQSLVKGATGAVTSLNGISGDLRFEAGPGTSIEAKGSTITITSTPVITGGQETQGPKWDLTGNTIAAGDFLGTLNNFPLEFQANNVIRMLLNTNNSIQRNPGGNARGTDAVDLQTTRALATQVASGSYANISGGRMNTASGASSTIGGGDSNSATNSYSTVGGGLSNLASGVASVVAGGGGFDSSSSGNIASGFGSAVLGGNKNNASGQYAVAVAGFDNTSSGFYSVVTGGQTNNVSGNRAFIGGGLSNNASGVGSVIAGGEANFTNNTVASVGGGIGNSATGFASTIPGGYANTASGEFGVAIGREAVASRSAQLAQAAGSFSTTGDAQSSVFVTRKLTTNATPSQTFLDGFAARITVNPRTAMRFHALVVGITQNGANVGSYELTGCIVRDNANNTSIVGAVIQTAVDETAGAAAWDATAVADNVNEALVVQVTGAASTTIRWVARIQTSEVSF